MNTYLLGIEYSEERIKCALLKRIGKAYELHALQNFESTSSISALDALVRWKAENLGDGVVKAVVSLSESLIFFKELTVPNAKESALNEAIYWELSENSPIPPAEAIYEWTTLVATKSEVKVSAMAIRESVVLGITQKLEEAAIDATAFEPSSVSLIRATSADYSKNTMLLMVGERETDIVVMKSGKPVFSTTADVILGRSKDGKWKLDEKVGRLIAEKTREMVEFWESKFDDKIQQVIITGDLVDKYFGLAQLINEFAKIPVNIARQKKIVSITLGDLAKAVVNRYFISIGAVGRFMSDDYSQVNLIPKDKKNAIAMEARERLNDIRLKSLSRYFTYFLIVLSAIGAGYLGLTMGYGTALNKTKQLINAHPAQNLVNETKNTNNFLIKINSLMSTNRNLSDNYSKISELTPTEIRFKKIQYTNSTNQEWIISGEGSREAVLAYVEKLQMESGAKNVTMPYSNLNRDDKNEFEVNLLW